MCYIYFEFFHTFHEDLQSLVTQPLESIDPSEKTMELFDCLKLEWY